MTQITAEQQQMLDAAATSVAAKLQTFQDGLTADEQQVLGLAIDALAASRAEEDVAGYAVQEGYVWKDGIGVVLDICLTGWWRPGQPLPMPPRSTID